MAGEGGGGGSVLAQRDRMVRYGSERLGNSSVVSGGTESEGRGEGRGPCVGVVVSLAVCGKFLSWSII